MNGYLFQQLEQERLLEVAQMTEKFPFHIVGNPVGLAHQRRALARERDVLLAPIVFAAGSRDQLTIDQLVADDRQTRCRDVKRQRHLPLRDVRVRRHQHEDREVEAAQLEGLADSLFEDPEARNRGLRQMNLSEPFTLNMRPTFAALMGKSKEERLDAYRDPAWRESAWAGDLIGPECSAVPSLGRLGRGGEGERR